VIAIFQGWLSTTAKTAWQSTNQGKEAHHSLRPLDIFALFTHRAYASTRGNTFRTAEAERETAASLCAPPKPAEKIDQPGRLG
jgi:hypothetical protein